MSSLKIRYALYGVIASASLITLVAQANTTDGVFGIYFRNMIHTACTGTGVLTGFDDIIGSAGYGTKICTGLSVPLAGYNIYPDGGNVGIGTSTPTAKLEVAGQVKITGGSPGLNKVLTSDADGLATWSGSIVTPCVPGGTGWNNTCYGTGSLQYNTTGNNNTANGYQALYMNTVGGHNVANGYQALFSNDTGGQNVAIGYQALSYNNTAYNNTAIGNLALGSNSNGSNNTAIGNRSLNTNDSGEHNLANGFYSLYNNVVGSNNVGLGSFTLYMSNGSNNTAIGHYAGSNLVTGTNNIAIGSYTDFANTAGSNQLNIGNVIYGSGLVGGLAGNIGIGTSSPTAKLEVAGNIKIGNSGVTCSATSEGQIRYNTTTHIFEGCNGTGWKGLTSNVAAPTVPIAPGSTRYPGCDTDDIKLSNGQIWSACNVGSTLAGTTAASYGSYFQWGRNVPFPSIGNVPTIAGPLSFVAANATTKFITGNPDNNVADWQTPSDNGAWGDIIGTDVARQGPCESGYHVPTVTESIDMFASVTGRSNGWTNADATTLNNTMKLPFAGSRRYDSGNIITQGTNSLFWSSSKRANYDGYMMGISSNVADITANGATFRSEGASVRCIKNNDIKSCSATKPTCANGTNITCTLATGSPTSVNQPWTPDGLSCRYTCKENYSDATCSTYTEPKTYCWYIVEGSASQAPTPIYPQNNTYWDVFHDPDHTDGNGGPKCGIPEHKLGNTYTVPAWSQNNAVFEPGYGNYSGYYYIVK